MLAKTLNNQQDVALLITRVVIGLIFVAHGIGKLNMGVATVAGFLSSLGLPGGLGLAWLLVTIEIVAGLALILGVGTRLAALLLSIVMLMAIIKVKWSAGLIAPAGQPGAGLELDLALLVGALSILLQGAGQYSVDTKVLKREVI